MNELATADAVDRKRKIMIIRMPNDTSVIVNAPLSFSKTAIIPTGIAIELPEGVEAQVRARSGFAAKNAIGLANGIGTIDTDYRGEIAAILINWGDHDFVVEPQMRIAQMVIARYETVTWDLVDELTESGRNLKKFGSTGLAS